LKHRIHVCALRDVSRTAAAIGAGHLVSAIEAPAFPFTPKGILRDRHLKLDVDDITQPKLAKILPSERHVLKLLDFVADWDQDSPLLIHCFAGMSRSTACAYIALCALNPKVDEVRIAKAMRRLSTTATPNPKLIALADDTLGRNGRMISAVSDMRVGIRKVARPFGLGDSDLMEVAFHRAEFLGFGLPFWPARIWREAHLSSRYGEFLKSFVEQRASQASIPNR
jgi:predicted protein tyrosine phosphatase